MKGIRLEDGEFTPRCLYYFKVGASPEALVAIRRNETSTGVDDLPTLMDEVKVVRWVEEHHKAARRYIPIIDSEIRCPRINAVHAAFAARRHDFVVRQRGPVV